MSLSYFCSKLFKLCSGRALRQSNVDKRAYVNYGSNLYRTKMGKYSYCGYDCWLIDTIIGNFTSISNNVKIGGPSHPYEWTSTSPVFNNGKNVLNKNFCDLEYNPYKTTVIGNDVWIGENCIVKQGVRIGDGVVVGSGSVVTKDIPSYEIWAGNPAKKIKDRFAENIKINLIESKWWLSSDQEISKCAQFVNDPIRFVDKLKGIQ